MSLSRHWGALPQHRRKLGEDEDEGEGASSIVFVVVVVMLLSSHVKEVGEALSSHVREGGRERSGSPGESGRGRWREGEGGRRQGRVVVVVVALSGRVPTSSSRGGRGQGRGGDVSSSG